MSWRDSLLLLPCQACPCSDAPAPCLEPLQHCQRLLSSVIDEDITAMRPIAGFMLQLQLGQVVQKAHAACRLLGLTSDTLPAGVGGDDR